MYEKFVDICTHVECQNYDSSQNILNMYLNWTELYCCSCATDVRIITKGQLISKCLIGSIVLTKKPTKFF